MNDGIRAIPFSTPGTGRQRRPKALKSRARVFLGSAFKGFPWISFEAIRFLDILLKPDIRVFEYGQGGLTIYFVILPNF
jgi:hypothetical protein